MPPKVVFPSDGELLAQCIKALEEKDSLDRDMSGVELGRLRPADENVEAVWAHELLPPHLQHGPAKTGRI